MSIEQQPLNIFIFLIWCHLIQYCVTALPLYCHSCYVFKGLRSSNQRSSLLRPICRGVYICNVWDNKFQVDIREKNVLCKHCQHGTQWSPALQSQHIPYNGPVQWCLPNWKTILAHLSWSLIESWYGETLRPLMVLTQSKCIYWHIDKVLSKKYKKMISITRGDSPMRIFSSLLS